MNIVEIDNISSKNLSEDYRTNYGIGLCYFDIEDELLKEFSDSITIPIYPREKIKRQFYIVKDNPSLMHNSICIVARSNDSRYVIKSTLDRNSSLDQVPDQNTTIAYFSNYSSNIIPITIEITNTDDIIDDVDLQIELEVK